MINQLRGVTQTVFKYIAVPVFLLGLIGGSAMAATNTWIVGSGDFNATANWDTGVTPASGDDVVFTNDNTYTISFGSAPNTMDASTFDGRTGTATLDISGQTWLITGSTRVGQHTGTTGNVVQVSGTINNSALMVVGDAGAGRYTVNNGTVTALGIWIGNDSNAVGTLTCAGAGNVDLGSSGTISIGRVAGATGNSLIVSNNTGTFTCGSITVGGNVAAHNNTLQLVPGSSMYKWTMSLGVGGYSNTVVVNDGTITDCGTLLVGATTNAFNNTMILTNGAYVSSGFGDPRIGNGNGAYGNAVIIKSGAVWAPDDGGSRRIILGASGLSSNNLLLVTGGGILTNTVGGPGSNLRIGDSGANFNRVTITDGGQATFLAVDACNGSNSVGNVLQVGGSGAPVVVGMGTITTGLGSNSFNSQIVVSNATFVTGSVRVGNSIFSSSNICTVLAGTLWSLGNLDLQIGRSGSPSNLVTVISGVLTNVRAISVGLGGGTTNTPSLDNTLLLQGGQVSCSNLTVGASTNDAFNVLQVSGGSLNIVSNLNVGIGGATPALSNTLMLTGGKIVLAGLRIRGTNTLTFTAGTLSTGGTTIDAGADNGAPAVVGNGVSAASLELATGGTGFHNFNDGLVITNAATLKGAGTVMGNVTVLGTLAPGFGIGTIVASNNVVFGSSAVLSYELGSPGTSDLLQGFGNLTLDGTVNLADAGGFGVGDYTLITYTGTLTDNGLLVGTKPNPSLTYTIDTGTAASVILHVTSGPSDPYAAWQTHYFPGDGPNALGGADPDHDGVSNTNEFLSGFNPTNPTAYAHIINIAKQGGDINVTYLGANGDNTWSPGIVSRTNVLEFTTGAPNHSYSNNFVSTGRTNILSGGTGVGIVTNMIDVGGATGATRYYRVRILAP